MIAYTVGGTVASMFVGTILGAMGRWLLSGQANEEIGILVAVVVAMIAIARELEWLHFPLPQLTRQTRDIWAKILPGTLAAALWGFDLGLIFTTWFTFSGVWLLIVVAVLTGEPVFGAALFALYWLGRALSVWIAPLLMSDASATPQLLDGIAGQYRTFQRIHVLGLIWSVVVFIARLTHGTLM